MFLRSNTKYHNPKPEGSLLFCGFPIESPGKYWLVMLSNQVDEYARKGIFKSLFVEQTMGD